MYRAFLTIEEDEGIPFHRIRYFKIWDRIVWDRESRLDLLTPGYARPTAHQCVASPLSLSLSQSTITIVVCVCGGAHHNRGLVQNVGGGGGAVHHGNASREARHRV